MSNNFGKDTELYIKTKAVNGKTILEDSYFTAPYKVAKPFYKDSRNMIQLMVMAASAGIMEGDSYHIKAELGPFSRASLLGQSYNKIHRMKDGYASQKNDFILNEGAFFDFDQKPAIPFSGSRFHSGMECFMSNGSSFLYSEILACGREKRGERFEFKTYKNCNKVYFNGELIFLDHQFLVQEQQNLEGIGFFEGYSHQATLGYFSEGIKETLFERIYEILKNGKNIEFGLTKNKKLGMIVRILGDSSDVLEKEFTQIREEIYNS